MTNLAKEASIPIENEKETSVSIPTARKYLDALTKIFILEELPPWSSHIRSKVRQRVSPKWHFVDPSIAAASLKLSSPALLKDPETLGFFFESLCIRDLRIYSERIRGHVSHYRNENNLEVDAIVELFNGQWAGFEIKLGGDEYIEEGAKNLLTFYNKLSENRQEDMTSLNILTAGSVSYQRPDGVNVIALGHLGPV